MTRITTTPAFFTVLILWLALTPATSTYADGNVTVTVSNNGSLRVKGENNTPQDMIINAHPADPNSFIFHNLDNATTFNGLDSLTVSGVDGRFRIDLGSGPKVLIMTEGNASRLTVFGDLQISNRGNDPALIILDTIRVLGRTRITTRNGDDALIVLNSDFLGAAKIRTGNGNDVVAASDETYAFDEYEVNTGNGRDVAILHDTNIFEIDIRCGGQTDATGIFASDVSSGRIDGNNGHDFVEIDSPGMIAYGIRAYEAETNFGSGLFFDHARADNPVYAGGILLAQFLDLGN